MTKISPQELVTVEPGRHTGRITSVKERKTPEGYEYIDFKVTVDGMEKTELTFSAPQNLGIKDGKPVTKLAVILDALGLDVTKEVDMSDALGTKIKYVTTEKKSAKGTFASVDTDTIEVVEQ